MIYCPRCGAANQDGSRFCASCGAPIPTTGTRCPVCGTVNPVGNVYCDRCHARLIPPAVSAPGGPEEKPQPIKGLSLPSRPLMGEEKDWLAQLRGAAEEPSPEEEQEAEPPAAEIPEWLLQLGVVPPVTAPEPEAEAATPPFLTSAPEEGFAQERPEWLAESGPILEEKPVPEGVQEEPAPEEFPSPPEPYLPEVPEVSPVEGPAPAAPSAGLPDWLAELVSTPAPVAPSGPPPFIEAPLELPSEEPSPFAPEGPTPAPEAPSVPPVLPDWLKDFGLPAPPEAPEAPKAVPPITLDWLEEGLAAAPSQEVATAVPPIVVEEEILPGPPSVEVPDWLLAARERPETAPRAPSDFGGLVPAEIPEWLKPLRPREMEEAAEEAVEAEGLLAGIRGALSAGRGLDMPAAAAARLRPVGPTPAAVARAELLQGLLARPLFQPPEEKREALKGATGWVASRLLVGLLLLAAILAPLLVQVPFFGIPAGSGVDQLYARIEALSPETPVLLAWEYGPVEAEEMDRVAGPVVVHLLRRGARVLIVSTRPEGPATAVALLNRWVPDPQALTGQVVNLGYQPGGASGVREILSNLGGRTEFSTGVPAADLEAMQGVRSVADVGMVLLLAAQPDDLRIWVEQIAAANPNIPVGAGVSARVEPVAGAYLGAGQLQGIVSGWAGGAAYERRVDAGQGRVYQYYLTSLGLAQLAVAALMVVGALVFLVGGHRK